MKTLTPVLFVCLLVGALGGLVACQQQPVESREEAELAVRAASEAWLGAVGEGDLEAALSFYAEDAFLMPYGAPLADDRAEIRQFWADTLDIPGFDLAWVPLTIEVSESRDLAYEVGGFDLTVTDEAGEPGLTEGKYVAVWARQADGQWKVVADIFNLNE